MTRRESPVIMCSIVSDKFEVSAAFRFRVNLRHRTERQTDGRTECSIPRKAT